MADEAKLAIIVHQNDEVTIRDERGVPCLCRDCRFSGWLTEWEFQNNQVPPTCLLHSGGADVLDGDRVIFDDVTEYEGPTLWNRKTGNDEHFTRCHLFIIEKGWQKKFPSCFLKNHDGRCKDFVRAQPPEPVSFWRRWLGGAKLRDILRRKMRL